LIKLALVAPVDGNEDVIHLAEKGDSVSKNF
jgi:hypothetical protein